LRIARILAAFYTSGCLFALALMAIGTFGLFNAERDPLSAVYAILLAMPWSLALTHLKAPVVAFAAIICGMALNFIIIIAMGRAIARIGTRV